MARFIVPALLVALIAGYVVGQQPEQQSLEELLKQRAELTKRFTVYDYKVQAIDQQIARLGGNRVESGPTGPVGRFVPAGPDRMLDTTNGTLYALNGDRWQTLATLKPPHTDDSLEAQGLKLDELLGE